MFFFPNPPLATFTRAPPLSWESSPLLFSGGVWTRNDVHIMHVCVRRRVGRGEGEGRPHFTDGLSVARAEEKRKSGFVTRKSRVYSFSFTKEVRIHTKRGLIVVRHWKQQPPSHVRNDHPPSPSPIPNLI